MCLLDFFFFQAEDGIRDRNVTGVQTCALPILGDRWRLAGLTINYRAPAEIMAVAADVLAAIDPALELPRSVRDTGVMPWRLQVSSSELGASLADATQQAAE